MITFTGVDIVGCCDVPVLSLNYSSGDSMKTLTGRMLAIAVGNSDLSIEMSHKYRAIYAEQGYELPEFNPHGFRPGKKSLPINRLGLPGTELKKSLAWIAITQASHSNV
jgi:hypothetical protein